ncbi:YybH family protein [Streptomyces sp. WZ-12]|uniref:YybH family protein n=1 Tax=Streptomyces sp. WZ-12 TaxID=3030210 RepID=UPI0023812676|nr:nuclear transport factor 2 family protein [Streptomyces sp. WZ-12]
MTAPTDPTALPSAFQDALNARDVDRVLALYSQNATMRTVTGKVISGYAALREEVEQTIAAAPHISNTTRHIIATDDTALVIVDWAMELNAPDGERVRASGTTANVASRGLDGTWRFAVLNPTGTAS